MVKTKKEKHIENLYNQILRHIMVLIGDTTTYLSELNGIGKKFKGVYPSDKIPKLNDLSPYAILNLDTSKQPGSHWVAIAKNPHKDETLIYDSFARKGSKIIKSLAYSGNGRIINSDLKDAEQDIMETNCGARCLAYLVVVEKYGWDAAKLI